MTNRYVHGGGVDQPLIWYQGDGTDAASQRGLFANWQGSITAVTDATGNAIGVNGYDAYGIPNETNIGRFQYTGQIWLPELGLYYYKARIYSPTLGRFLQTDPIGYEGGYNIYRYAINDPVNYNDPTGNKPDYIQDQLFGIGPERTLSCNSSACKAGANFIRGVASVPKDVAAFAAHSAALSGLRGSEAKNRANLVESSLNRGIAHIAANPEKSVSALGEFIVNNPAFTGGRIAAGAGVSALGGPGVSAGVSTIGALGGGISALNGVVDQLEGSGLSTDDLSNNTVGQVFLGGAAGGTVNFNAKTGDLTTTFRSPAQTGSRIDKQKTVTICNAQNGGC